MYTAERAQGQPFRLLQPTDKQLLSTEMVNLLLLSQEAEELKLQDSETTSAALQLQTTKVMARAALDHFFATNQPNDDELLAEYEKRRDGMYNTQLKARHILVASVTEANNLIAELDAGADFSELAKAHSTDGGSGSKGGDLGWFKPSQMVKSFADAAEALKVGERSAEAVQSEFGWHILMLDDRKELAPPPFNAMKAAMTKFVQQNKVEEYLTSLEDKFEIVLADEVSAEPDYGRNVESLSADHQDHSGHNHD
jgi:peptidyl-prolyl cis-trans isomerase C